MAELHAVAVADLADLLTVVERWAGFAKADGKPPDALGSPSRRASEEQDTASLARWPAPVPRSDEGWVPEVISATHPAQRMAERVRSVQPRGEGWAAVRPEPTPSAAPFGPWRSEVSPGVTHWSGRLPSRRTALHDEVGLAGRWASQPLVAAITAMETASPPRAPSVLSVRGADRVREVDARVIRAAPKPPPAPFVRSVPVTHAFPTPVLAGRPAAFVGAAETAHGARDPAAPADASSTGSMVAAPTPHSSPSSGLDPDMAEIIGLDRLGEAMADAIEAALLDAGVDLS